MVACCNLIFRLYVQVDFLKLGLQGIALYLEEKKMYLKYFPWFLPDNHFPRFPFPLTFFCEEKI